MALFVILSKRNLVYLRCIWISIFIIIFIIAGANALKVQEDLRNITQKADEIVLGEVINTTSYWTDEGRNIETTVCISVDDPVKGSPGQQVTFTLPGGTVGTISEFVEDEPRLSIGEKGFFFLKNTTKRGRTLQGSDQGFVPVLNNAIAITGRDSGIDTIPADTFSQYIRDLNLGKNPVLPRMERERNAGAQKPKITAITPSSASSGTNTQITITGSGFGTKSSGSSLADVVFLSQYLGESEGGPVVSTITASGGPMYGLNLDNIVSWSNTNIKVQVPGNQQKAGYSDPIFASSGYLEVTTDDPTKFSERTPFSIPFGYLGCKWNPPVPFKVNNNCPDTAHAVDDVKLAFDEYNYDIYYPLTPSPTLFEYTGPSAISQTGLDNTNLICWEPPGNFVNPDTIAQNLLWLDSAPGSTSPIESDIRFNTNYHFHTNLGEGAGEFNIQTLTMHELGHAGGLSDLYGFMPGYPSDQSKIMFGFANLMENRNRTTLHSGDIQGIRWIYAPSGGFTYADLKITSFPVPKTAHINDPVLLKWTVKNTGTKLSTPTDIRFYLSADNGTPRSDQELCTSPVPPISPGKQLSGTVTPSIPTRPPDTYYISAIVDRDDTVLESDENNNLAISQCTLEWYRPDLYFSAHDEPSDGVAGGTILISDTVKNKGNKLITDNFTINYKLTSPGSEMGGWDIGSRTINGLYAGSVNSKKSILTIPPSITPGSYYMNLFADSKKQIEESDESNNQVKNIPITISPPGPDLKMMVLSGPGKGSAGGSIVLKDTVRNQGTVPVGRFDVGYYLVDPHNLLNTYQIGNRTLPSLGAGVEHSKTSTIRIPPDVPAGSYYLCAVADDTNQVTESNELNNALLIMFRTITITSALPDLAMKEISCHDTGVSGDYITISDEVANVGTASAKPFYVGFFLETQTETGQTVSTYLGERYVNMALKVNASNRMHTEIKIPVSVSTGDYRLVAFADWKKSVTEINETNNRRDVLGPFHVDQLPDLKAAAVVGPVKGTPGGTIVVNDSIKNVGYRSSGPFVVRYSLLGTTAEFVLGCRTIPNIDPGQQDRASTPVMIPAAIPPGQYQLRARADPENAVQEVSENNNNATAAKKVTISGGHDTTPPESITDLLDSSYGQTDITWTWTDPPDPDFSRVLIWFDGVPQPDVPKGQQQYTGTGLSPGTSHTLSTHTIDTSGNINLTWVNRTAATTGSAPVVSSINPESGYAGDTLAGDIGGGNFLPDPLVEFVMNGVPNLTPTVTSVTDDTIDFTMTIPWETPEGYRDVYVTNTDGQTGQKEDAIRIRWHNPWIGGVTPSSGYAGDGTISFTITGGEFRQGASARLWYNGYPNDIPVNIQSLTISEIDGTISIPSDAPPGNWRILVTNPNGYGQYRDDLFQVLWHPAPTVTSIHPPECNVGGYYEWTIGGSNFRQGAQVSFEKTGLPAINPVVTDVTSSTITCNAYIPASLEHKGYWDVNVTNTDGRSGIGYGILNFVGD